MKVMKKTEKFAAALSALLAASMLFCTGCSKSGEQTVTDEKDAAVTTAALTDDSEKPVDKRINLSGYKIVEPGTQTASIKKEILALAAAIEEISGGTVERVKTPSSAEDAKEIIIGDAASDESTAALATLTSAGYLNGYVIKVDGSRIIINGTNLVSTAIAVRLFRNDMIESDGGSAYCTASGEKVEKLTDTTISVGGTAYLQVDEKTVVYQPSRQNPNANLSYGKIIVLEHNGDNNGLIFVTGQSIDESDYIVHVSKDGGKTFEIQSRIRTKKTGMVANWQPCIYELPCAVGDLAEGTLIFAGCVRDNNTSYLTEITLWKSTNLGETWSTLSVCAKGGGLTGDVAGLWEPFLYAEDGKLYCLYSDETDPDHSQMLSLKYTEDGKNWSDRVIITACADKKLRPGMIAMTKLPTGEYFVVYEMVGIYGNPIHYKKSKSLTDWGDTSENGTIIATNAGEKLGSSPYCVWTPLGGENGMIIVTGKFMASGASSTGSDWLISFDLGNTWKACDNPLPYKDGAYSPGMFVAKDGSIYYANSVECDFRNMLCLAMTHITVIE